MGIQRDTAEDEAVIVYFGDGATSQGDVSEAFAWASVYNTPVVFFCQNNQYAISEPLERQTRVPLYQRSRGFGFVELPDGEADRAIQSCNGKDFQGRSLVVNEARPLREGGAGGGGRDRPGGGPRE